LSVDEKSLTVEEKKKKKKLIDGMKRKIKGRTSEDEEELTMLAIKTKGSFKMDADGFLILFNIKNWIGYWKHLMTT
jgi:hypothetical protein